MYRIVTLTGKSSGHRQGVWEQTVYLGSDPACRIHIQDDPAVEPRHARIEDGKEGIFITVEHPQGILLHNEIPVKSVRLLDGDEFQVGETRMLFKAVKATATGHKRRISKVQSLTLAAVVLIILVEIAFLVGFAVFQAQSGKRPVTEEISEATQPETLLPEAPQPESPPPEVPQPETLQPEAPAGSATGHSG